jgi:hypothetical protein
VQVLKQECKHASVLNFSSRVASAQDLSLFYDRFIVRPPHPSPSLQNCFKTTTSTVSRAQVLGHGGGIAEMGRPQDLLADPSSL